MSDYSDSELESLLDELDQLEAVEEGSSAAVDESDESLQEASISSEGEVCASPDSEDVAVTTASEEPDRGEDIQEVESVSVTLEDTPDTNAESAVPKAKSAKKSSEKSAILDPDRLAQDIQINTADLDISFTDQAGKFIEYATIAHRAAFRADSLKNALELIEMKVDKELRDELLEEGKKVVESALSKAVVIDKRVIAAKERYAEAKMIAGLAKESLEGFKQRRDMLIQMGAAQREELKGELLMKAKAEDLAERKSQALGQIKQRA